MPETVDENRWMAREVEQPESLVDMLGEELFYYQGYFVDISSCMFEGNNLFFQQQ
jgi:hypothetical protein